MAQKRSIGLFDRSFSTWANVASNLSANALAAVAYLVYVPLVIRYFGVEGYGLVGIFLSLQTILTILDLGLSVSLNRELAVRISKPDRAPEMRDLVRTSETIYWSIALIIAIAATLTARPLAAYSNPQGFEFDTVVQSFLVMGVALAFHFPIALYSGGLYGIQRQAQVSAIFVVFSLLKTIGSVLVLEFISPTTQAFFIWQAMCAALHAAALGLALRRGLPAAPSAARLRFDLLSNLWRFSAGVGLVTIIATLISQIDKAVLVRLLTLENFGYYSIATTLSGNVQRLIQPIFQAYFPKLADASANSSTRSISSTYHQGSQALAVVVLPVCSIFVFFAPEILFLWQRDAATVQNSSLIVSLLMAGSALNSLLYLPYALQLANGWTRLQVIAQLSLGAVSVPLTILLAMQYGGVGAAAVWVGFNLAFIAVSVPIMHRRVLPGEGWYWFLRDVVSPLAAVTVTAFAFRLVLPATESALLTALGILVAYAVTAASAIAVSSEIRGFLLRLLK